MLIKEVLVNMYLHKSVLILIMTDNRHVLTIIWLSLLKNMFCAKRMVGVLGFGNRSASVCFLIYMSLVEVH
jgi:hypothetical protein